MADEAETLELEIGADEENDLELVQDDFFYDEDSMNLVPVFMDHPDGRLALKEIQQQVSSDFKRAYESCKEYREKVAEDWRMFCGDLPPKEFPYENSANPHMPIALENISRLAARVNSELFGDWDNIFGVVSQGPEDEEQAKILSKHGNWQIREAIPDFFRQMDRAILSFFFWGDVVCHSFYDPGRGQNRHEVLTPDEFVMPYVSVTTMPDLSDVPFYCRIFHYYRNEIERKGDTGAWFDVDRLLKKQPPSWDDDPNEPLTEAVSAAAGIEKPDESSERDPYKVVQFEGWLSLPNQARERWCQVIFDADSHIVMSMRIHEEPDWRDQMRYEQQVLQMEGYHRERGAYDASMSSRIANKDTIVEAMASDVETPLEVKQEAMLAMDAQPPPIPPIKPEWMTEDTDEPEPPDRVPVRMFTHAVCLENMKGSLGLSFGKIQADFNRAANTLMSQFIDAATLNNCKVILTSQLVEFEKGKFDWTPGAVNRVDGIDGNELKNNIMEFGLGAANPQLREAANDIYEKAQSAVQAPAVLSGEPGKSGETYRGIATRIEQATKQLSVAARKFAMTFLKPVLVNNARLNAIHLPDYEIFPFTDPMTIQNQNLTVTRRMYEREYKITIHADLRFASEAQKVQEAMELVMLPGQVPPLQQNYPYIYKSLVKLLEARGDYDMIPYLGPDPTQQPPAPPPGAPPPGAPPPLPPGGTPQ